MRRQRSNQADAPGQDAFLDVVANLVGILIILVIIVAAHTKSVILAEEAEPAGGDDATKLNVASAQAAAQRVEVGLAELQQNIARQQFEIAYRNAERDQIQKVVLLAEQELVQRREQMSEEQKARLDLEQQIAAAKNELGSIQVALATSIKPPPTAIPHLPTPMAKTVFSTETHFRLLGGRLVYVPLTEMIERLQADAPSKVHRLQNAPRIEESLPIVQGFGGRYVLRRTDTDVATKFGPARQSRIELEKIWLEDAEPNLGEPLKQSLQAGSQFRARLAGLDRERSVITVWVYPDSFEEFRTLKGELYKAGFLTAARPLPTGVPVGGSPDGSRSSAE
jgi:hypothetical protein